MAKKSKGLTLVRVLFFAVCISMPALAEETSVIAVWDLENLTPFEIVGADVGEILSAKVIETFKESGHHTVVERERLLLVLEELNLGTTDLVSESTRLELGKIVGARRMVFGSYILINDTLRLDLRMVEVETGLILKATSKTTSGTDITGWLKIAQESAEELL
jgi:hypothetical protein